MKKFCLILICSVIVILYFSPEAHAWTANCPNPRAVPPNNTDTCPTTPNTCSHIIDPFSCYDSAVPTMSFVSFMGYYIPANKEIIKDELGYNPINIDDHPGGVGDQYTLTPHETVYFSAPDTVLDYGAKVQGIWFRQHDNEDNATYKIYACDVNESGDSCSTGWYVLKDTTGVHSSGENCKEPCTDNDKGGQLNQGCPGMLPHPVYCTPDERAAWPCAISYDEYSWPEVQSQCQDRNIKRVKIYYDGEVDTNGHIHIADYVWIIKRPEQSICSVTPSSVTATGDATGKKTFSVTTSGTYKGTAGYAGVNFRIQRKDGTALTQAQKDAVYPDIDYTYQEPTYLYYNYYLPVAEAGCVSDRNVPCSKTFNLTLPAGDYNLYCEVVESNNDPSKCTGQPWCNFNGGPKDCETLGYRDCGANDNAKRYVNLPCLTNTSLTCNYGATVTATGTLVSGFANHSADRYRFLHYPATGTTWLSSQENVWANPPISKTFPNPIGTGLGMGTTYRWVVQARRPGDTTWSNQSCALTPFVCDNSSCSLTLSPRHAVTPGLLQRGQTEDVTVTANPVNGTIVGIGVTEAGTVVGISPTFSSGNFKFTVTGLATAAIGAGTTISAKATMNTGKTCELNSLYKITEYSDWWKVVQGDVWTIGNVAATVPAGSVFSEHVGMGYTGFPGIPFYASNLGGNLNDDDANISNKGWNADTNSFYGTPVHPAGDPEAGKPVNALDYEYFFGLLPSEIVDAFGAGTNSSRITSGNLTQTLINNSGFPFPTSGTDYWFYSTGDLTTSGVGTAITLGQNRKVVVFVNGNLNITKNIGINSPSGNSVLVLIVKGDIVIDPAVTYINGIYITDGKFSTGSLAGDDNDSPLLVEGTVISWGGGVDLQRDRPVDIATPGEVFTYRPDYVLNIPKYFSQQSVTRREVNP